MKSEWREYLLGDLYNFSSGLSKNSKEFGFGKPFLSFKTVFNNYILPEELPDLVNSNVDEQERCSIMKGDIFLTRTSETLNELGMSSVALRDYPEATFNGFTKRLRPKGKQIYPLYVAYYMRSPFFRANINSMASMTTRASLNNDILSRLPIQVPTYGEQEKIGDILYSFDKKIKLNHRINNNLYQQLDTIYRATYPYLPSDELPAGWNCVPLGTLCDSISIKHSFDKEKLVFLNTGDVENGHFLHSTYSLVQEMPGQAKKSIKTNDILYSEIRPINRHFAFVNFQADDYVVSTKLMVIRSREMDSRRLYHFLTTQDVINELQIEAESRSGTFPQIRFENIQRLPIIIAPPDIELQFTQILKDYYNMIDSNICENQHLATLRDSILPKLMSGEIDVSELDI